MSLTKLPPIEKIAEAYSVLVDQRMTLYEDHADVISSTGEKQYTVLFHDQEYASNDSATYWQGYPGYPIIALWMKQGILPYKEDIAMQFQGVAWKILNTKYKRDYKAVVEALYEDMDPLIVNDIRLEIEAVYEQMKVLPFTIKKNTKKAVSLKK